MLASALVLLGLSGAQLGLSSAALADTVINFDDISAGSGGVLLTNQYAADGVTFGVAAPFLGPAAPMYVFADPSAFSAPNDVGLKCGENCQTNMWAEFSSPQQHVSMELENNGVNGTVSSVVNAYDASGTLVASTSFHASSDQWQQVTVTDSSGSTISYVEVVNWTTGCCPAFLMDNFSFGGPSGADFALIPQFDPTYGAGLPVGGTTNVSFTLRRFAGSTGNISFSTSNVPAGVSLSLSPNPDSEGDNTTVQGKITASPGAQPVSQIVTVTATPDSSSGSTAHTVSFPITVQSVYKLRVQGLEITQGVQNSTLPARNQSNLSALVTYSGVQLVDQKPTVVRVFADAPGAPGTGIQGVTAELTGTDAHGNPLPGGPIDAGSSPDENNTGGLVDSGSATVPDSERDSTTGSFDFLLPTSWEGKAQTLTVKLVPPNQLFGPPPAALACTTAACDTLATMTMTGISYAHTGHLALGYVLLTNGSTPPALNQLDTWTRLIPATSVDTYGVVGPNAGTIDISQILGECSQSGSNGRACFVRQSSDALNALSNYVNYTVQPEAQGFLGVTDQEMGVETGVVGSSSPPLAVVDDNRPVTDVDHEIGHMLGLPHASGACGAPGNGAYESWPPDQRGELNSIGLNITSSGPYTVIAPANKWYDFMSYCAGGDPNADGTLGNTDAWVSARNWNAMVSQLVSLNAAPPRRAALGPQGPRAGKSPATMRVFGFSSTKTGTKIDMVDPTATKAPIPGSKSGFTVVAVGGKGKATASAPLYEQKIHVDGDGEVDLLQGALPLSAGTAASSLEVKKGGTVLATFKRPATAPAVTLKSTPGGACLTGPAAVNWNVTDKTKAHLTTAVDFSADGGKTWTEVYDGPAGAGGKKPTPGASKSAAGGTKVPRVLLKTTKDAELRVRVSDGYNQVTAKTTKFCVAAVPPGVAITAPAADQLTPGGSTVLSGTAFNADGSPVTGTALTWRADGPGLPKGGVRLGTGSPLVAALPPATSEVSLTATSGGLSATATERPAIPVIPLKPINGWTGAPSGTSKPAAEVVDGIVHLKGAIATKGTNVVAFKLPPELRPLANVYVPVDLCKSAKGRLFIQPDGTVSVQYENSFSDAQCLTSLDGASYALTPGGPLIPLNGWFGGPFGTSQPAATLVSGVVHLMGAIATDTSTSQWVFTLPPALRPSTDVYVPVDMCGAANGRLDIQPDGTVTVEAENSISDAQCFTSLDGATYALHAGSRLGLLNGWTGAPYATSDPTVALVSGVVQFKGAMSTSGSKATAFTLPAAFRPTADVYMPVDLCNATNGRLLIKPNGTVTVQDETSFSDAQCFTSLDGASFVP